MYLVLYWYFRVNIAFKVVIVIKFLVLIFTLMIIIVAVYYYAKSGGIAEAEKLFEEWKYREIENLRKSLEESIGKESMRLGFSSGFRKMRRGLEKTLYREI